MMNRVSSIFERHLLSRTDSGNGLSEIAVRMVSRLAGYLLLLATLMGIALLVL
jgi:hypothetical protein